MRVGGEEEGGLMHRHAHRSNCACDATPVARASQPASSPAARAERQQREALGVRVTYVDSETGARVHFDGQVHVAMTDAPSPADCGLHVRFAHERPAWILGPPVHTAAMDASDDGSAADELADEWCWLQPGASAQQQRLEALAAAGLVRR